MTRHCDGPALLLSSGRRTRFHAQNWPTLTSGCDIVARTAGRLAWRVGHVFTWGQGSQETRLFRDRQSDENVATCPGTRGTRSGRLVCPLLTPKRGSAYDGRWFGTAHTRPTLTRLKQGGAKVYAPVRRRPISAFLGISISFYLAVVAYSTARQ
jgi:hypothetical protein